MAQVSETFDTYDGIGNREDLSDIIWSISPTETPFIMAMGRGSASGIFHEWQTDSLAAVDTGNAVIDGDDATNDAVAATTRIGNRTQISDKVIVISGTQEAVDKAGRKSEMGYQIAKKGKELRRDMEAIMTRNQASVTGNATTARKLGSLEAWYTTNSSVGATGTNGGFSAGNVTARGNGTQRNISESLLKGVIKSVWDAGGEGNMIMVGPFNKQAISTFTGVKVAAADETDRGELQRNMRTDDKRLVTAIDVYVSDFGDHQIVPNRFSNDRTCHVITPRLWAVDFLRSFRTHPLAKTGDAEKRQLLVEYTLRSSNEAGSGILADLNTS